MVIFMTSSSSSKTEFMCIFYDVFDVGVFAGSSFIEVSHLYIIGSFLLPLLSTIKGARCLDSTRRLLSNKLEFARFGVRVQKF